MEEPKVLEEERQRIAEALKAALWNLNDYRGPRRGPILRRLGGELGRMVSGVLESEDPRDVLIELSDFWQKQRLGDMQLVEDEPWRLEVRNCYECLGLREVGEKWCSLKEGLIESVLAERAGTEYHVTEEECCGTVGDRCVFRLDT